jgi:hypothetical protein
MKVEELTDRLGRQAGASAGGQAKEYKQQDTGDYEDPAPPGISFIGRGSEARSKHSAQGQTSDETSQVGGVGYAGDHSTEKQVVSRE